MIFTNFILLLDHKTLGGKGFIFFFSTDESPLPRIMPGTWQVMNACLLNEKFEYIPLGSYLSMDPPRPLEMCDPRACVLPGRSPRGRISIST